MYSKEGFPDRIFLIWDTCKAYKQYWFWEKTKAKDAKKYQAHLRTKYCSCICHKDWSLSIRLNVVFKIRKCSAAWRGLMRMYRQNFLKKDLLASWEWFASRSRIFKHSFALFSFAFVKSHFSWGAWRKNSRTYKTKLKWKTILRQFNGLWNPILNW